MGDVWGAVCSCRFPVVGPAGPSLAFLRGNTAEKQLIGKARAAVDPLPTKALRSYVTSQSLLVLTALS